ncbi:MAG: 50S ribosomal protein L18 [Planctomycetes bacterium]|nr:50S ribosomal protein L18 [Planctomycetota bacterium]
MDKIGLLAATQKRRRLRVRNRLRNGCQYRLSVHTTGKHVYAQLIDDVAAKTIAFANSCEDELASRIKSGGNVEAAKVIGELIAKRAIQAGVSSVRFDRGARRYHGRIAAVAEAARKNGLQF